MLALTPHTPPRALLAPTPPPSSKHSQFISQFWGEVCLQEAEIQVGKGKEDTRVPWEGGALSEN